jgi:DNA-binding response OmpR family regulator
MDQEMPIKDGNAATQEIRQLQQEGKAGYSHILGVSANVREAQTTSMRAAGMDDIISKPFMVDDLVKRIKSIVLEDKDGKTALQRNEESETVTEEAAAKDAAADEEVAAIEESPVRSKKQQNEMKGGGSAHIELESQEEKDRRDGRAGKKSGREGVGRGGERSMDRQKR